LKMEVNMTNVLVFNQDKYALMICNSEKK